MVLTDDESLHRRMLILRDHGRQPGDTSFQNREVAYKYKMSAMQAAVGLAQLERLPELIARKQQIFRWYAERLGHLPTLSLNAEPAGTVNTYWMVTAIVRGRDKGELASRLASRGIQTRPFFNPLSSLFAYAGSQDADRAREANHISYGLSPYGINLPSALSITEGDVERVCEVLRRLL